MKKNNCNNFNIIDFKKLNKKKTNLYLENIRSCYNHYVIKNLFFTKNLVNKMDHEIWFQKLKKKKFDKIYIATNSKEQFLGYVRSKKYYNYFFISIAMDPMAQNRNIASKLLNKLIIKTNFTSPKFIAIVKKKNTKSINFFHKNNFKITNIKSDIFKKFYKNKNLCLINNIYNKK